MKRPEPSTTTAFNKLLKISGWLLTCMLCIILLNEAVFYYLTRPLHRGDLQLDAEKAAVGYKRLFLGSSRTHMGINTPLLDSLLGTPLTSYNLGANNCTLLDQYLILENHWAQGGQPQEVVIELTVPSFDHVSQPILLQKGSGNAWSLSKQLSVHDQYALLSSILSRRFALPYSLNYSSKDVNRLAEKQGYDDLVFPPQTGWQQQPRHKPLLQEAPDSLLPFVSNTRIVVEDIIGQCRQHQARPLFILPVEMADKELYILGAVWHTLPDTLRWQSRAHHDWPELAKPAFWQDFLHLNEEGARLYTSLLAETYPLSP